MKTKQKCELCRGLARIHCESDQAILCWTCDFKVHTANFLVARHSRTLLCNVCQSPTPWTATGTKLGPTTVSVCHNCLQCADNRSRRGVVSRSRHEEEEEEEEVEEENHTEVESDAVDEEEDVDDENEQEDDEEEGEEIDNQVVPWSPTTPPPPAASSSNSDEEDSSSSASSSLPSSRRDRKRMRKTASDLRLKENHCCRVSRGNANEAVETAAEAVACGGGGVGEGVDFVDSLSTRNLKRRKLESGRVGLAGSSSLAIVESVKRLHRQEMGSTATIAELCRLSEDPSAVDTDSSECS